MDELDRLLREAERADGTTRIEYRDPIAAHGAHAVRRLATWLRDERLCFFALVTIARAAHEFGASEAARDVLAYERSRCAGPVRQQLDKELARLSPTGRGQLRPTRMATSPGSLPETTPTPVGRVVRDWVGMGRPTQPVRAWHQDAWRREFGSRHRWLEKQPARIGREHIRPLCRDAATAAEAAERSLVAMMTWGAIDFGYRCKWTRDMLATPGVHDRLTAAAATLATAGPVAAYGRLHHTGDCHVDTDESVIYEGAGRCQGGDLGNIGLSSLPGSVTRVGRGHQVMSGLVRSVIYSRVVLMVGMRPGGGSIKGAAVG